MSVEECKEYFTREFLTFNRTYDTTVGNFDTADDVPNEIGFAGPPITEADLEAETDPTRKKAIGAVLIGGEMT